MTLNEGDEVTGYTPATVNVRSAYIRDQRNSFVESAGEHGCEFDRWLAAHDASVLAAVDRQAVRHALWDFPENVITLADLDAKADTGDLDYAETREYLNQQADAVLALLRVTP